VRKHGATAVLFDVKMCGLVPDGEKELPRGEVKRVAARQGESCDTVCPLHPLDSVNLTQWMTVLGHFRFISHDFIF